MRIHLGVGLVLMSVWSAGVTPAQGAEWGALGYLHPAWATAEPILTGGRTVARPSGPGWECIPRPQVSGQTYMRRTATGYEGLAVQWADLPEIGPRILAEPRHFLEQLAAFGHIMLGPGARPMTSRPVSIDSSGDQVTCRYRAAYGDRVNDLGWRCRAFGSMTMQRSRPTEALQIEYVVWRPEGGSEDWQAADVAPEDSVAEAFIRSLGSPATSSGATSSKTLAIPLTSVSRGRDGLWVTAPSESKVMRLDARTLSPSAEIRADGWPRSTLESGTDLWVTKMDASKLACFDIASGKLVSELKTGKNPVRLLDAGRELLCLNYSGKSVTRVDRTTRKRVGPDLSIPGESQSMAVRGDTLWVADEEHSQLIRILLSSGLRLKPVPVDGVPKALAMTPAAVWVACSGPPAIYRIAPEDGRVLRRSPGTTLPAHLVTIGEDAWVGDFIEGSVRRVSASTGEIGPPISIGRMTFDLITDGSRLYVVDAAHGKLVSVPTTSDDGAAITPTPGR